MKNSTKRLLAALGLLTAFTMALSACDKNSGGGTSGNTSGQTSGTSADTQSESQSETTAPPTTTTAAPETVAPMEELTDKGEVVYDAVDSGDFAGFNNNEFTGCTVLAANEEELRAEGSGRLTKAGGAESPYFFVGEGGKGLGISSRQNDYDSVDVLLGELEPGDYTLQVKFSSNDATSFVIQEGDASWAYLVQSDTDVTEATVVFDFTISETGIFKDEDGNVQNRLRLVPTTRVNYYVNNIRIYKAG